MRPYYDDGQIQVFHGDCRDVLSGFPKGTAHIVVTDPPYGQSYSAGTRQGVVRSTTRIANDEDPKTIGAILPLIVAALRDRRHLYAFGRWGLAGLPMTSPVELVWDKGSWTLGDLTIPWAAQHEVITFAVKRERAAKGVAVNDGNLAARLRRGSILRYSRPNHAEHPTAKPVGLLRELIEMSSRFDELVLDPFMGCGPTLVAARLEGRRAIGIEIEERYCEVAVKRLQQSVLALETA